MRIGGIFSFVIMLLAVMFMVMAPSLAYAGIGVSPAEMINDEVLNNVPHTDQVVLTRSGDTSKPADIKVEFRGEAKDFLQGEKRILFKAGESQIIYEFQILANNAPNGEYSAEIDFINIQGMAGENQHLGVIAILGGVTLQVRFKVSDTEKLEYQILSIEPQRTEEGLPLFINYTVKNSGNTNWRPDFLVATLFNSRGRLISEKTIAGDQLEFTESGVTNTYNVLTFEETTSGAYTLKVDFKYNDKVDTLTDNFEIFATGVLKQSGVLTSVVFDKTNYNSGDLVKFDAIFTNNGETSYFADLVTEVYSGESIVDILKTEPVKVSVGETKIFSQELKMAKQGEFRILTYVEYGNRTSATETINVDVVSPIVEKTINYLLIILSGLLVIFIALFVIVHKKTIYKHPPKINSPLRTNSPQITGTSGEKDGALVEVFVNGISIGATMVQYGFWAINVEPNTLIVGNQVVASVRTDINRDGVVNLKDKQSAYSDMVTVVA